MKRWYVVHAYSGFEKSVAQALRDRIVRDGMEERFGDVLVPTEEVIEMRAGQKRRSERKFFPGYVLVQIETHEEAGIPRIDNESWHLVKETPRVMGFIGGTADRPLPIADSDAEAIFWEVWLDDKKLNSIYYEHYVRVKIFTTRAFTPGAAPTRQKINAARSQALSPSSA